MEEYLNDDNLQIRRHQGDFQELVVFAIAWSAHHSKEKDFEIQCLGVLTSYTKEEKNVSNILLTGRTNSNIDIGS